MERITVTQKHPWNVLERNVQQEVQSSVTGKWVWPYLCVNSTPSFERKQDCLQCQRECMEITINLMTNMNPYGGTRKPRVKFGIHKGIDAGTSPCNKSHTRHTQKDWGKALVTGTVTNFLLVDFYLVAGSSYPNSTQADKSNNYSCPLVSCVLFVQRDKFLRLVAQNQMSLNL